MFYKQSFLIQIKKFSNLWLMYLWQLQLYIVYIFRFSIIRLYILHISTATRVEQGYYHMCEYVEKKLIITNKIHYLSNQQYIDVIHNNVNRYNNACIMCVRVYVCARQRQKNREVNTAVIII